VGSLSGPDEERLSGGKGYGRNQLGPTAILRCLVTGADEYWHKAEDSQKWEFHRPDTCGVLRGEITLGFYYFLPCSRFHSFGHVSIALGECARVRV